jgi:hypothetical protein
MPLSLAATEFTVYLSEPTGNGGEKKRKKLETLGTFGLAVGEAGV